jgi:hypothetical protein
MNIAMLYAMAMASACEPPRLRREDGEVVDMPFPGALEELWAGTGRNAGKTCPECGAVGHGKYCTGSAASRHKMRRRR